MAIGNNDLIWPKKLLNADKKKKNPVMNVVGS